MVVEVQGYMVKVLVDAVDLIHNNTVFGVAVAVLLGCVADTVD